MNWDRVERLIGAKSLALLQQKKVAVIGLGSGGGFVATGLAMSGVGRFVLFDDDLLEAHNIVRHVADQRDLGRPKAEIMRDLVMARNPAVEVTAVQGRVEDHPHHLEGVDLVVCAVDGEGAKYLINELALARGLPVVYAGVYERGEGGDVALIEPYSGPCYACWASTLREGLVTPAPDGSDNLDYGLLNEQGTLDAEPGLWLHVVRVASTQADMALNRLLKETPAYRQLPGNTVILANTALEILEGRITPPYSAEWVAIERDPRCLVCGDQGRLASTLSLNTLAGDLLSFDQDDADALGGN